MSAYTFVKDMKKHLDARLQQRLEEGAAFDLLPERLDESNGKKNKDMFIKTSVKAYEDDFKDAAKDDDKEVSSRAKKALKGVEKLKSINEDKFEGGVPARYEDYLANQFAYIFMHQRQEPTLREDIDDTLVEDVNVLSDEIMIDWSTMNEFEKDAVIKLKELGRQLGSDVGAYVGGVLRLTFGKKDAVQHFTDELENQDFVDSYEIEAHKEGVTSDEEEVDFDTVVFDEGYDFDVYVYLYPEIVSESEFEYEAEDDEQFDENTNVEFLQEVRRRIKVNFRGKRRIKMQCRPGFKWDPTKRSCVKITGRDVAIKRKAMRKMVRTKKSKGTSFRTRVLRKTRKAKRFRKSMGLK